MRGGKVAAVGICAAAAGVAFALGFAAWDHPRVVAWRWRNDVDLLRDRCLFGPTREGPSAAEYAAVRMIALDEMQSEDPRARGRACSTLFVLGKHGIPASPAADRASRAALVVLLADTRPTGPPETFNYVAADLGRRVRVCDIALFAAGRPGCVTASAEITDRACAEARAEIERELARP